MIYAYLIILIIKYDYNQKFDLAPFCTKLIFCINLERHDAKSKLFKTKNIFIIVNIIFMVFKLINN